MHRRGFLATTGAAFIAPATAWSRIRAPRGAAQRGDALEARVHQVLHTYDTLGVHRTATEVDRASGEWLRSEAARAGAAARVAAFPVDRLDVHDAFVEVSGRRIEGLPFFDAGTTSAAGVSAPIGQTGVQVATADRAAIGTEGEFLADARRSGQARAIVVVTTSDIPGLVPSNARRFADPYGCPVLQVPSEARAALDAATQSGEPVRVVCHATRARSTALNVVSELPGKDPSLAPVVVITPRSGWWTCAAERGGGIACWLEAIRAVGAAQSARPVRFLASSGHELGHLGLESFLHDHQPLIRGAHVWVHLGANIGAGVPGTTPAGVRVQASHDELDRMMAAALQAAGAPLADPLARGRVPAGEARNIHLGGGRYVSLIGQGNRWFHHADDRYPKTVTASSVARYARGIAACVVELARS